MTARLTMNYYLKLRNLQMKHKIKCRAWGSDGRELFVSPEGRLWPCCLISSDWDAYVEAGPYDGPSSMRVTNDEILQKKIASNPDWNKLSHYSFSEILNDDIMAKYWNEDGWNSENPPTACLQQCNVNKN